MKSSLDKLDDTICRLKMEVAAAGEFMRLARIDLTSKLGPRDVVVTVPETVDGYCSPACKLMMDGEITNCTMGWMLAHKPGPRCPAYKEGT